MNDDQIFENAIAISDSTLRRQYISTQCNNDSTRSGYISRLVDSHFSSANFMNVPASSWQAPGNRGASFEETPGANFEKPGDFIGPFELIEEIGRGGMAVVFRARQAKPIHRDVAVKIIKPGLETRQVLARMDFERQTLALMNHVNIASVYDAGLSPLGRPYFVMELVNGVSVTGFCDASQLNQKQRIELLIDLCGAVEHAHRQGIIHRDIKPSNLLVAGDRDSPVPKIIDFGIAKMLTPTANAQQTLTALGQVVGTPQYMSPEQAGMVDEVVDTRTDVYSLGAVLYELVTGHPPVEADTIAGTLNRVVNESPRAPSSLNRNVGKDLETICLCCLRKNPDRRYDSAKALSEDLSRFLEGRPIKARPVGVATRLWKWACRAPAAACLWVVSIAALLALVGLWAGFTRQLKDQRDQISNAATQLAHEKTAALDNFHQAHQAIRRYLDTVRTHTPLGSSHDLIFQRELLETGMEFYDELLAKNRSGPGRRGSQGRLSDVAMEQATLYMEHGKVLLISQDPEGSIRSFNKAVSILSSNDVPRELNSDNMKLKLGTLYISMAKSYLQAGQTENAGMSIRKSIDNLEQVDANGSNTNIRNWNLAMAWKRMGVIQLAMQKNDEAGSSLQTALKYSRQLPGIFDFQLTHAESHLEMARHRRQVKQLKSAIESVQAGLAIIEGVCVRSTPTLPRYTLSRIACLVELANCQHELGNLELAVDSIDRAIELQQAGYEMNPLVEQYAIDLAAMYEQKSDWMVDKAARSQALAKSNEILELFSSRRSSPGQLMIQVQMFLTAAMRNIQRCDWKQAVSRLEISLQLVNKIDPGYESAKTAELRRGIHHRLAEMFFCLADYDPALGHFEKYREQNGVVLEPDQIKYAVCLAELGRHREAADEIRKVESQLPSATLEIAYFPLIELHRLLNEERVSTEEIRAFLGEIRETWSNKKLLSGLQFRFLAFSLCRMVELIEAHSSASQIKEPFCTWARTTALQCLEEAGSDNESEISARIFDDDRIRVLKNLSEFRELRSKLDSRH